MTTLIGRKRRATGVCVALVCLVGAGAGSALAMGTFKDMHTPQVRALPGSTADGTHWAVNARGQTYGSLLQSPNSSDEPVLARVIATNGQVGYVYSDELNPSAPASPAAAVAQENDQTSPRSIPVYAVDGTTVIGTFSVTEDGAAGG